MTDQEQISQLKQELAKTKNELIDLKNHVKKEGKKYAQVSARKTELEKGIVALNNKITDDLKDFEKKHAKTIDSVIHMVEQENFNTLPSIERGDAVRKVYNSMLIGK